MATNRLSAELREGYLQIADCLSQEQLELVARARDPINSGGVVLAQA